MLVDLQPDGGAVSLPWFQLWWWRLGFFPLSFPSLGKFRLYWCMNENKWEAVVKRFGVKVLKRIYLPSTSSRCCYFRVLFPGSDFRFISSLILIWHKRRAFLMSVFCNRYKVHLIIQNWNTCHTLNVSSFLPHCAFYTRMLIILLCEKKNSFLLNKWQWIACFASSGGSSSPVWASQAFSFFLTLSCDSHQRCEFRRLGDL